VVNRELVDRFHRDETRDNEPYNCTIKNNMTLNCNIERRTKQWTRQQTTAEATLIEQHQCAEFNGPWTGQFPQEGGGGQI
jgi:hypothetical protein